MASCDGYQFGIFNTYMHNPSGARERIYAFTYVHTQDLHFMKILAWFNLHMKMYIGGL